MSPRLAICSYSWLNGRPETRPPTLAHEDGWRQALADAGYDPGLIRRAAVVPTLRSPDDLDVLTIASRALDRCAAQASTWSPSGTRHALASPMEGRQHLTRHSR